VKFSSEESSKVIAQGSDQLPKPQSRPRGRSVRKRPSKEDIPWRLWGVEEVVAWLTDQGLERYVETFRDCDCQGEDLELIGDQELNEEFEVENAEDRKLILEKIQILISS